MADAVSAVTQLDGDKMVSRHTITHADELYAGDAFLQGSVNDGEGGTNIVGSPDGRWAKERPV